MESLAEAMILIYVRVIENDLQAFLPLLWRGTRLSSALLMMKSGAQNETTLPTVIIELSRCPGKRHDNVVRGNI